jgi:general secretion pathway protein I
MIRTGGERGSTLLEVLVAFAILTGAVVLSFRIFSDGLRGVQIAEERSEMAAIARREIARLELSAMLQPAHFTGKDDNGFSWFVEIAAQGDVPQDGRAVMPFRVRVMVGKDSLSSSYPISAETILLAVPRR